MREEVGDGEEEMAVPGQVVSRLGGWPIGGLVMHIARLAMSGYSVDFPGSLRVPYHDEPPAYPVSRWAVLAVAAALRCAVPGWFWVLTCEWTKAGAGFLVLGEEKYAGEVKCE